MTSIKLFWSLAVHRHQKQHSMSYSFGQAGCRKTMVKNENFHAKICQNLKFFDIWELYTSKESLEHVQYKFKKRKYDFLQKKKNLKFLDTWDLYTLKESLEHVQYKFKRSKCDFLQKNCFWKFFQKFQKQIPKMTFLRPFKDKQVQSQEFWWSYFLLCRDNEAVYDH